MESTAMDTSSSSPSSSVTEGESDLSNKTCTKPSLLINNIRKIPQDLRDMLNKSSTNIFNVQEKIVFVIDRAKDEETLKFKCLENNFQSLLAFKKAVEIFLGLKKEINSKHEFALAALNENRVEWLLDFTNNIEEVKQAMKNMKTCLSEDIVHLDEFFEELIEKVEIPINEAQYVVRVIFLYNREYATPQLNLENNLDDLFLSPYFFCDFIISHSDESDNVYKKLIETFKAFDKKNNSVIVPVSRNMNNLLVSMANLLAHPLQRYVS